MKRVAVDDCIPAALPPGVTAHDVRNAPGLRRVALALDQLVNRADAEERAAGKPDPPESAAHAGDFAEADRQIALLDATAAVGRAMSAGVRAQFPTPPKAKAKGMADPPAKSE